jgi:hypothetical protein
VNNFPEVSSREISFGINFREVLEMYYLWVKFSRFRLYVNWSKTQNGRFPREKRPSQNAARFAKLVVSVAELSRYGGLLHQFSH